MHMKLTFVTAVMALRWNSAAAAILTQTCRFERANTQISSTFGTTLHLPKWNPAKFTPGSALVGVEFQLGGIVNGTQKADSDDDVATDITLTTTATLSLSLVPFGNLIVTNPSEVYQQIVGPDDAGTIFDGLDSINRTFSGTADRDTAYYDASYGNWTGLRNAVIGTGSLDTALTGKAHTSATGAGNVTLNFRTYAEADGYVKYFYDVPQAESPEVPELKTYALTGSGFAILGLLAWRRAH